MTDTAVPQMQQLQDELDDALDRLHRIHNWCEAYPLEVFPKPDLQRARELLGDDELTRLNAHSMRHVVDGIKRIAALEDK